jgi:predicted nuclease of predicted toxin-antitoxin system
MKLFAAIYTDEDISNLVATLLQSRGFDVLTTISARRMGYTDSEQLKFATTQSRCLLTHNRVDFEILHLRLMERQIHHSGIIIVPQKSPYEIAQRVGLLLDALTADEIANQLLYA